MFPVPANVEDGGSQPLLGQSGRQFYSEDELLAALSRTYDDQDRQRFSLILHWAHSTED